ncbi:hypothetical protein OAL11_00445 [bacterium]|nr:hypothetical protein [bacterium]
MEVQAKTHSPMPPMDRSMSFIDIQRDQKSDIKQRRKGHKNRSITHHTDIIEALDENHQIKRIGAK